MPRSVGSWNGDPADTSNEADAWVERFAAAGGRTENSARSSLVVMATTSDAVGSVTGGPPHR